MDTKYYKVIIGDKARLVEAQTKAQALAFVARNSITVELASQKDLAALIDGGVKIEKAKAVPAA